MVRGAHVERVFILGDISEDFRGVLDDQIAAGVQVYIAQDTHIPRELYRNIAIYDEKYLVEDQVNAAGSVTGYLHSVNESDVADALGAFARLKTLSHGYPRPHASST